MYPDPSTLGLFRLVVDYIHPVPVALDIPIALLFLFGSGVSAPLGSGPVSRLGCGTKSTIAMRRHEDERTTRLVVAALEGWWRRQRVARDAVVTGRWHGNLERQDSEAQQCNGNSEIETKANV